MLSSISHELRTPLNCSIILTRLALNDEKLDLKIKEDYLLPSLNSNLILLHQINDIIDLNHIWNDQFSLCVETFNLTNLVEDCVDMFRIQARQ
jgi:signal transduction histidine kinase